MSRRVIIIAAIAVVIVGLATWGLVRFLMPPDGPNAAATPASGTAAAARRISATLYYIAADGMRLVPAQREVLFGATPAQQARYLIEAQLEPPPAGMTSAIPPGVTIGNVFVADNGDAYVDFSVELRQQHPGGSLNEIFTVYTIVHALTTNLPAIHGVQILVGGHEVDTLAGHVDLRRPLPRADQWLQMPPAAAPPQPEPAR